jgi:DNA polymerase-1
MYNAVMDRLDDHIYKRLKIRDLNIDSSVQLVDAMEAAGCVDREALGITEKDGLPATDKNALRRGVTDPVLLAVLLYRGQLKTCLRTFMEPWLATAERSKGRIFTTWNQIRGDRNGTRTGRLSSTPNFQNIPLEFDLDYMKRAARSALVKSLPPLPLCRGYLVAPKGKILCGRDFASQELRVLAHFEDGAMAQGYHDNPSVDFHQLAADMVTEITGVAVTRKRAKTIGFAILYGTGRPALAAQLGVSVPEADRLLAAYFMVFPGIRELQSGIKTRALMGQPIRTAGGREYFAEPPRIDRRTRRVMRFEYKLLNYLIQGSSADQTKDAMIRFHERAGPGLLLASVHDELLIAPPVKEWRHYMMVLRDSMNNAGLDVPMLSDGERGVNWAAMEAVEI